MKKEGSWEVKKCLWHGVPFLVLSALRYIQEKMEAKKIREKVNFEVEEAVSFGLVLIANGETSTTTN